MAQQVKETPVGEKGARQSSAGAAMAARLEDELVSLGEVATKKMFGGFGVFKDGVMFALVDSTGIAFLRADDATKARFEAVGSERHSRMPYWQIPADVLDDAATLIEWAGQASAVALAAKKK